MDYEIKIIRQYRGNMMMRTTPGAIEVYIPRRYSKNHPSVQAFIKEGLKELGDKVPDIPPEKTSREAIKHMVRDYASQMEVKATRIQFRDMRRKWGSCSSKGTITLNSRLTWLDADLAEYIVCHELAHLIELNHSKRFWTIVEQHMPDYKTRLNHLRQVEKSLDW